MKNKKTIMAVSAIFILIFHLWINITNSVNELVFKQICVIGVDMFFFVSAYSISKKDIVYKKFISNRFNSIYFKFLVLAIIAAIYSSWSKTKFIRTIFGIELFIKGGGSFLWFLPGIMIIYFLIPFYKKMDDKNSLLTIIGITLLFIISSILISLNTNYNELFILTNRIPILLIGYYFGKYNIVDKLAKNNMIYFLVSIILFVLGLNISYYTIINRIRVEWFYDIFYILNIPLELGFILILNKIKSNKVIDIIGSCTLELYGLQMIFGFKMANKIYMSINNPIMCNIIIIIILIICSIILKKLFDIKDKLIKKINYCK